MAASNLAIVLPMVEQSCHLNQWLREKPAGYWLIPSPEIQKELALIKIQTVALYNHIESIIKSIEGPDCSTDIIADLRQCQAELL